ncbi:MAG TPA: TolC family protein [Candidatus Polarisedimenticolia bacterium]|nr:TolC family protein [Candidatus Polarisedimenticolia bacterium]
MKKTPFVLLAFGLMTTLVAAENPPVPAADPAALLNEAEEKSPVLRAARARLEGSRHVASEVSAPPDPEVSLAYTNDGLSQFTLGDSEFAVLALNWTQEIRPFGKRQAAGEVAASASETGERQLDRLRYQVLSSVKIAYADLFRIDRTARILEEIRATLGSLEETARRRYDVGQGTQESVLKAQTEILLLEAESTRLAQERKQAESRLNAAVGRPAATKVGPAEVLLTGGLPVDTPLLERVDGSESPEIAVLEADVRRTQAEAKLARLEKKPDMFWSASYQYRGDLDPMVMGMFGVRLPLYADRKQAQAVARAESEVVAAGEELANRRILAESELRERVARTERADRLIGLYDQSILPQAANTLESAQVSYSVGKIGLLDILGDLKMLLEARKDRVALDVERMQALAELEPLVGLELLNAEGEAAPGGNHAQVP